MSVRARTAQILRAQPLASGGVVALPGKPAPRRLLRGLLQVVALLAVP